MTDIVRLDSWLQKNGAMKGMKMEQTVKYYLQRNIWITTRYEELNLGNTYLKSPLTVAISIPERYATL